jgi:glucose dehydrogenase
MDDPKEPAINATTNAVNSYQQNVPEKKGASSWDEQEDYIYKSDDETKSDFEKADKDGDGKIDENEFADMMKSGMAISKDEKEKPKEKKRSGEYELPPLPEY